MGIALASVLGAAFGVFVLAALLVSSLALVVRFFPGTTGSARAAAVVVVALWILVALFHALAWVHLFRIEAALLLAALGAALAGRSRAALRGALEEQRAGLRELARELHGSPAVPLSVVAGLILFARLLRGLVAPPLGWDALTYHLVKVARWIRTGGFQPEAAPDCWGAYEYFPYSGDVLWAWAMLPFRGDAPLALAGILAVLGCLLAVYALARELGAERPPALLAGLAFAFLPSCVNFATTGYVDNVVALETTLGLLFLCRVLRGADVAEGVLACAALGVGVGTKAVAIPILGLGGLVTLGSLFRRDAAGRRFAVALAAFAAGAVALPSYVRAFLERGSPLYPLPLVILGRTLVPGNPVTEIVQAIGLGRKFRLGHFLEELFLPNPGAQLMNPGPGAVLLLALALAGVARILVKRPRDSARVFLLLVAAGVIVVGLTGPNTNGLRTSWEKVFGRFLLTPFAVAAALAAPYAGKLVRPLLAVVVGTGLWFAIPMGWSAPDVLGVARLFGLVALCGTAAAGLVRLGRRRERPVAGFVGAGLVAALAFAVWGPLRAASRTPIYEAAAARVAYDPHTLNPSYAAAWTLWRHFDGDAPFRLAVSAGWTGVGDNWYRYPLYGSRLQNELLYVTTTADGSVVDALQPKERDARASRGAWLARLAAARIDALVLLSPTPPLETRWVAELPRVFPIVARAEDGRGAAFRFDADEARRVLENTAGAGR